MTDNNMQQAEASSPSPSGNERRITKRLDCDGFAEVVVPLSGFLFRGEISNISEFGCFVNTRARLSFRRTTPVELRFTVCGEHFSVHARTANIKLGIGAGFEFSEIEPTAHKNLLQLIDELESNAAAAQPRRSTGF